MKKIIIASAIIFSLPLGEGWGGASYAQSPGSLDLSFDTDGKVTTVIGSANASGQSVVLQPDGKIIVAGYTDIGSNIDFALARYNSDGSLDNSFDSDGKLTTDFGGMDDRGNSVTIQSDGKILLSGSSFNGTDYDFALARYNIDGSLDNSFDIDGKLTTDFASLNDAGNSVVLQPDGKIIVGGGTNDASAFALARYNSNGSLDTSFDSDGKQTTIFGGFFDGGNSVVLQSDGKIILAGTVNIGANQDFALVRYNSDGSLDNSFDSDGMLTTDFASLDDFGSSVVLQADGKILVAGSSDNGTDSDFALARYNSDGSLDITFDGDGKLTTAIGSSFELGRSAVLQQDGKILVAGYSVTGVDEDFALVRYNSDGSLDVSFSSDGKLTTDFASSNDQGFSVAIQSDGKIVVAGYSPNGPIIEFAVARYISGLNMGIINFSLDNNSVLIYPNPIAQESKLEYILNTEEIISIALFNMQGKMVKTFLNNEMQEAGSHSQILAFPTDLASGSYFIVVSTPRGKVSVKIMK